ncbi:MAG: hypothetical protein KDD35_09150, partial [Bdellovibrionales bacterium]|nr:hypothetical protein [Bdellovibrionales bacterium]
MYLLGISCYYHDSAVVLLRDGEILAAAQEERFTRIKHDPRFPRRSLEYCLSSAGISLKEVSFVTYYDKPFVTFERLLETYISTAPWSLSSFSLSMPIWLKEKLNIKWLLRRELMGIGEGTKKKDLPPLLFTPHHLSHAASAFFPSPFKEAAVLCLDGVGEWATSSVWSGSENNLNQEWEIKFPHSLGLLYSAFTYFAGFKVNSGEYKLMGLAPYGKPIYANIIREQLIDIKSDGTFRLNMEYFDFATGRKMTNKKFSDLFGGSRRRPESPLTLREMNLASSIQEVTEEIILKLARTIRKETGKSQLCMAGGVALNCVANGHLSRNNIFDRIWIQPAAGDAGGALGAALSTWHQYLNRPRLVDQADAMKGAYLGPEYSQDEIHRFLEEKGIKSTRYDRKDLILEVARHLSAGKVVAWYQGKMEYGPRALGNRSILGDPRDPDMQEKMNLKIKFRESFRHFAPAVLAEKSAEVFDLKEGSPYMLLVGHVKEIWRKALSDSESNQKQGLDQLKIQRSLIPAVTHVDYSARVQSVHRETNPLFYELIEKFE